MTEHTRLEAESAAARIARTQLHPPSNRTSADVVVVVDVVVVAAVVVAAAAVEVGVAGCTADRTALRSMAADCRVARSWAG